MSTASGAQSDQVFSLKFRQGIIPQCKEKGFPTSICECTLDAMQAEASPEEIQKINSDSASMDDPRYNALATQAIKSRAKKLSGNFSSEVQKFEGLNPGISQFAGALCKKMDDSTGSERLCACATTTSASKMSPDEKII